MKVYVLTHEPYHDNSTVMGAYASLEAAQGSQPGEWEINTDTERHPHDEDLVCTRPDGEGDHFYVYELDLQGADPDPARAFALAVLSGDGSAIDAVKDVLRL